MSLDLRATSSSAPTAPLPHESSPLKRAIAEIRATDPIGYAPVPDDEIAKLFATRHRALGIALSDLGLAARQTRLGRWLDRQLGYRYGKREQRRNRSQ